MYIRLALVLPIILLGWSCATKVKDFDSKKPTSLDSKFTIELNYPPFSPVQMQIDSTEIIVRDYFPLFQDFEIIRAPQELKVHPHLQRFTLYGNLKNAYDYIDIKVDQNIYSLILKNHGKTKAVFEYKPNSPQQKLQIKGSFNNWNTEANPLKFSNGVYSLETWLKPGEYPYKLVENGVEINDETNPVRRDNGLGGQNNIWKVGNPSEVQTQITSHSINVDNQQLIFKVNSDNKENLRKENWLFFWQNQLIDTQEITQLSPHLLEIKVPIKAAKLTRSFIRVFSKNDLQSNDILVPLRYYKVVQNPKDLNRKDFHDNVMYEVFVDRFYNGNKDNDRPVNSDELFPGTDWQGGDLQGLYQKMKEGYFTDLHMNAIWISPIAKNPEGMYGHMTEYGVDTKFTGYHGYWPISLSTIDDRMGDEESLEKVIEEAHQEDSNIFLDYVANHVHEEHPIVKNKMGWITPMYLPDGRKNNRLYEEQRLTTWFDDFMPTLDLEREDVADIMTDSAVYWFQKYDIDGFRHDATKHIPNSFWRKLTYKIKTEISIPQSRSLYQIGETYGSNELINSYVNTAMLDAQFDFNMFDATKNGILNDDYPLTQTVAELKKSLESYGYHHLMGNISGNHDKGRSISYADGSIAFNEDAKEAGYTRKIENINGDLGFRKMAQFFAFTMFIPGIPVVYYGDEIGMPGGDDPDNRRMMQFEGLNHHQEYLKNTVAKLAQIRRERMELMYGDTQFGPTTDKTLVLIRTYLGKTSILLINTTDKAHSFEVPLETSLVSEKSKSHFGNQFMINVFSDSLQLEVAIPPRGFDIISFD